MKTTKVRKLLPDTWGFVCPVHTPDGGLCGLLNHLSIGCKILCNQVEYGSVSKLTRLCSGLGMLALDSNIPQTIPSNCIPVVLDGKVLGFVDPLLAEDLADKLREYKVMETEESVHKYTSITFIPPSPFPKTTQYPGVWLYTELARPLRKVINLIHNKFEWLDP